MIEKKPARVFYSVMICDKCGTQMECTGKTLTDPPAFLFSCKCGHTDKASKPYPVADFEVIAETH